jgi:signal transduction histidine kinase
MDGSRPSSPPALDAGRVAALVVTALAVTTLIGSELAITRGFFEARPEIELPGWALAACLAGFVVIVVAAWTLHVRVAAAGMAVAAIGAFLPIWSGWSWMPATVRVAVIALPPLVIAGLVRVVTSTAARLVDVLVAVAVLVHLAGYNAFEDPSCMRTCADVRTLAEPWLSTRSAVLVTTLLTLGAVVVAVAVVMVRRTTVPSLSIVSAVAASAVVAMASVVRWSSFDGGSEPEEQLVLVPVAAVSLVGAALCVGALRTWRTRAEVRRLVESLSAMPTSIADTSVRGVEFAMPDGRWIDAAGQPASPIRADGLVISDGAGPTVRLLLATRDHGSHVLAALTPATRLALHNARLSAIARARVEDLHASRRRIVSAVDAERRRIERDLHDGAQQRLVSATLHLQAAIARGDPAAVDALARADAATRHALERLRSISHGIFPSVVTTGGLRAALDGLIGESAASATLRVNGDLDVDAATAMAAYATAAAALASVDGTGAEVAVARRNGAVTVTVRGDGAAATTPDFTDLADRVGAVRGQLAVSSDGGRLTITAVLPCGS